MSDFLKQLLSKENLDKYEVDIPQNPEEWKLAKLEKNRMDRLDDASDRSSEMERSISDKIRADLARQGMDEEQEVRKQMLASLQEPTMPEQEGFMPTAYERPNYVEQDAPGMVMDQLTTPLGMEGIRGSMPQSGDPMPPMKSLSDVQQYVQKKRETSRLKDLIGKMAPQSESEPSPKPEKDMTFENALDRMQKGQLLGGVVDASAKLGAGIAGLGANTQVDPSQMAMGEQLANAEAQDLQKFEATRNNEMKEIERQLAKDENSKNSPYSKMVQGLAKQLSPALAVEDLSAKQIFKVLPALQGMASAKAAQEYRKMSMEMRMGEKDRFLEQRQKEEARRQTKEIYNVVKDFEKDKVVTELKKQGLAFDQAQGLLQAMANDNKVAIGALGTKMARAMGEVGVLTDADVVRYIQRMDVAGRVQDFFSRNFEGKVSDFTQKDLEDIANIMQMGAGKKMNEVREKYINYADENFAKPFGIPREELLKRFGVKQPKEQAKPEMSAKDKAAKQWAEQNKDDPRASQILEKLKQKGF